jgi:putative transposase
MARLPRLAIAGHLHLILQRGHPGRPVCRDNDDRRALLDAMFEVTQAADVAIHGYALLDHELLFLATPEADAGLGRAMQALGRHYGASFNRRHAQHGSLWSGRFRSCVVEPARWALPCLRHVELAAVRSGEANEPGGFPWSSAGHHLGTCAGAPIRELQAYWALGNTPFEREAKWAQFLHAQVDAAERASIQSAGERGWALGSEEFISEAGNATGRRLVPRKPGRPVKSVPK